MQLPPRIVDDFKTDRKEITPPLQPVLRLIPMLFYLALLGMLLLGGIYLIQLRLATAKLAEHTRGYESVTSEVGQVKAQRGALENQILKAQDIEAWVASSRPLQPLTVAIARSVADGSTIEELRLNRDEETGSQVRMNLRLGTNSMEQLDRTIQAVEEQHYRLFSPQQTVNPGEIDYQTTLVWQENAGASETPAFR